jgi:calcineurin-like phosphoesterase family protein
MRKGETVALTNKTWVIADTHFGHSAVIKYSDRPFSSAKHMEEVLIQNWNKKVKNGHDVIVLGDFALTAKVECERICKQLNGNKLLIKGNHDSHSNEYYKYCGFAEVSKYPIVFNNFWIMSHEPILLTEHCSFYNIHGHTHNLSNYNVPTHMRCCVSVENTNYAPVDFSFIENRAINLIERVEIPNL